MSAVFVGIAVNVTVPLDLNAHLRGEGVHDGSAYAVQTAGNLIDRVAELAARMKNRIDNARGRNLLGRMDVHGDTAAVIDYGDAAVFL